MSIFYRKRGLLYLRSFNFYFMNTKYTAATRQINAAMWFQCKDWPWKRILAMMANTMRDMHSWITFSWTSEKGPPLPWNPILLAGTWQQYSKKAIPHENAMTPIKGQLLVTPVCWRRKCPYQASVMKMLLRQRRSIVYIPFISSQILRCKFTANIWVVRITFIIFAKKMHAYDNYDCSR